MEEKTSMEAKLRAKHAAVERALMNTVLFIYFNGPIQVQIRTTTIKL